jgi:hypothetical protein
VCGAPPAPTTPFISNLPSGAYYGGSFLAVVQTTGDGQKFVTSASSAVCTVGADGLTVHFTGLGACVLTAHVTAGATYPQADGSPQTFAVGRASPTSPRIVNLPTEARVGDIFLAAVVTSGDGPRTVTSTTPRVCLAVRETVIFFGTGTCTLVAHVSTGAHYLAASGNPQSFTVSGRIVPPRRPGFRGF